jgi:hypothetical protein
MIQRTLFCDTNHVIRTPPIERIVTRRLAKARELTRFRDTGDRCRE